MFIRWLLFETRVGVFLLTLLEQRAGLAVVQVDWLATQRCNQIRAVSEAH